MAKILTMAGSGLTKPSEALDSLASQSSDEAIINEQLQNEIESLFDSKMAIESRKSKKRKSRDRDDFGGSDANGSPRKKRSEKNEKREQKRLSKLQHGRIASPESSARGDGRLDELTSATPLMATGHTKVPASHLDDLDITEIRMSREQDEAKSSKHRNTNLLMTGRRTSLGSNREALLQSILKSCGTDSAITKTEHIAPSRSETGEGPVAPITSGTPEASSKEKSRRKVSMVPILPEGYKPDRSGRFYCPIEGCDKIYSRRSTLGRHMNTLHAGEILRDNSDGTMTIVSPVDYQKAISGSRSQMIVEIPSVPLPRKSRKKHHPKVDDNKAIKALPSTVSMRRDSQDRDAAHELESSEAKAPNPRGILYSSKRSPITAGITPSRSAQSERSSSEYETSGENESSDIEESPRPKNSANRSSQVRKPQPNTPTDAPSRSPTVVKPVVPGRLGAFSSGSFRGVQRESSKDGMEDWEIEPGVIDGSASESCSDSETEHNTAYSSVYINSAEAGVKLSGVHFQVIRIAPGCTAPGPKVPYLRVCSVAAGKVLVRVGERSFSIGANGMWRIRAGELCTVANRHYSEAVIHVSTIKSE